VAENVADDDAERLTDHHPDELRRVDQRFTAAETGEMPGGGYPD
jgi:hypothetical protein